MQLLDPRPDDVFKISNPVGRIVLSLFCAFTGGLGLGVAIYRIPEVGWRVLFIGILIAAGSVATEYGYAKHGTLTRTATWFLWTFLLVSFADTVRRTLSHKIYDPFADLVFGAIWLVMGSAYLWKTRHNTSSQRTISY